MYNLIDSKTGAVVRKYKTGTAAHKAADRMDSEYGAARYRVCFSNPPTVFSRSERGPVQVGSYVNSRGEVAPWFSMN